MQIHLEGSDSTIEAEIIRVSEVESINQLNDVLFILFYFYESYAPHADDKEKQKNCLLELQFYNFNFKTG